MLNNFTKITRLGYGSKVKSSFGGIIIGLLLFAGAFPLLYWNEGRVDVSEVATEATIINSELINSSANQTLISTTGKLTSEQKLSDNLFLKEENYILLNSKVEMYSWMEIVEEESETATGGSETITTTYEYTTNWAEKPNNSSTFEYTENHFNPAKQYDSEQFSLAQAKVGVYTIDVPSAEMPTATDLSLTTENILPEKGATLVNDQYLFMGNGSLDSPQVGDLRISYTALIPGKTVTAFGKLNGNQIETYVDEDNSRLYKVFEGTHDEAVATMHTEYVASTWIFRALGFIMMWIGLSMLLAPLSTILSFIPLLGSASRSIISIISFIISLILAGTTIIVSMVIHSLIALLITLGSVIIGLAVIIFLFVKKNQKPPSKQTVL